MSRNRATPADTSRHISDLARGLGWHRHQARRAGLTRDGYADGFPPIALLRYDRLAFVTVLGHGHLTSAEQLWLEQLPCVETVEAYVVIDGDLSELTRALRKKARTTGRRRT